MAAYVECNQFHDQGETSQVRTFEIIVNNLSLMENTQPVYAVASKIMPGIASFSLQSF